MTSELSTAPPPTSEPCFSSCWNITVPCYTKLNSTGFCNDGYFYNSSNSYTSGIGSDIASSAFDCHLCSNSIENCCTCGYLKPTSDVSLKCFTCSSGYHVTKYSTCDVTAESSVNLAAIIIPVIAIFIFAIILAIILRRKLCKQDTKKPPTLPVPEDCSIDKIQQFKSGGEYDLETEQNVEKKRYTSEPSIKRLNRVESVHYGETSNLESKAKKPQKTAKKTQVQTSTPANLNKDNKLPTPETDGQELYVNYTGAVPEETQEIYENTIIRPTEDSQDLYIAVEDDEPPSVEPSRNSAPGRPTSSNKPVQPKSDPKQFRTTPASKSTEVKKSNSQKPSTAPKPSSGKKVPAKKRRPVDVEQDTYICMSPDVPDNDEIYENNEGAHAASVNIPQPKNDDEDDDDEQDDYENMTELDTRQLPRNSHQSTGKGKAAYRQSKKDKDDENIYANQ